MDVDHHELRRAFGRFLAAKRALRQAYQGSEASNSPPDAFQVIERGGAGQVRHDSVSTEELWELKGENERLRRSLALLHAYSLRVHDQRDILSVQRDKLLDACETIATWMRYHDGAEGHPSHLLGQLDDAMSEITGNQCAR